MRKNISVLILTGSLLLSGCSYGCAGQSGQPDQSGPDYSSTAGLETTAGTAALSESTAITSQGAAGQETAGEPANAQSTTVESTTGPAATSEDTLPIRIDEGAPAADFSVLAKDYTELPEYMMDDTVWRPVALRQCDLSKLNLQNELDKLLHAEFDMQTIWPESMPEEFDPQTVMDMARTPGLAINTLHEQGITGKGIAIAIIDQPLLLEHNEYKDRVKGYEVIGYAGDYQASMHGPLMTSIAAGKSCGVAPEADIYFFCGDVWNEARDTQSWLDYAAAVDRVLALNTALADADKIRVISISASWKPEDIGYAEIESSIAAAKEQGILVLNCNLFMESNFEMCFQGLDRSPTDSREEEQSYSVVAWEQWLSMEGGGYGTFYQEQFAANPPEEILLVPMNSVAGAAPTGADDYTFYRVGGWSSAEPYLAGMYALACQVDPDITPDQFWDAALETGSLEEIEIEGIIYTGKIMNPVKLIESLQ